MSKVKQFAGEKLDERFGIGFTDLVSPDGLQDPTNSGQYSKKELLAEFRNRPDGINIDEGEGNLVDKYQGLVDSGATFNKRAQDYLTGHGVVFGSDSEIPNDIEFDIGPVPVMPTPDSSNIPPEYLAAISKPTTQTISDSYVPDMDDFGGSGVGSGIDFDQTLNVNQNNPIASYINGDNNSSNIYQYNGITNSAFDDSDGLYAQRDPEGFKNLFMKNFFS